MKVHLKKDGKQACVKRFSHNLAAQNYELADGADFERILKEEKLFCCKKCIAIFNAK